MKLAVKSIVLVDDEQAYVDLMRQLLSGYFNCPVYSFSHPLEALHVLPSLDPAVVVTDYFMPELNGVEFIRRASPLVPKAAFVMISGNNISEFADELPRLSLLKSFLAKPVSWLRLAEEVARVWPAGTPAPTNRVDATTR